MRTVLIETLIPDAAAGDVFAKVCDFASYPLHTNAVRQVLVTARTDGTVDSQWSVNFRNGVLYWAERDLVDPVTRRIVFDQTDGDFDSFSGEWAVDQAGPDVTVSFRAMFDLGMPSLAAIIDPIAERALTDNMHAILRGLLGDRVLFLESAGSPASSR